MGVRCTGIPLELCNCLQLPWPRRGGGGGPGSGDGGLEAPSQGSILISTTGGCVSGSLEPRVLISVDRAAFLRVSGPQLVGL